MKASLRHRPDRIILGEIRSGEAFDLLQLLNTGHAGTLSTIHANSAKLGMRIQDAAKYLSATTWQIETLLRENRIPSFVLGKRRVIDRLELDRYVERRNAEAKAAIGNTATPEITLSAASS